MGFWRKVPLPGGGEFGGIRNVLWRFHTFRGLTKSASDTPYEKGLQRIQNLRRFRISHVQKSKTPGPRRRYSFEKPVRGTVFHNALPLIDWAFFSENRNLGLPFRIDERPGALHLPNVNTRSCSCQSRWKQTKQGSRRPRRTRNRISRGHFQSKKHRERRLVTATSHSSPAIESKKKFDKVLQKFWGSLENVMRNFLGVVGIFESIFLKYF